MVRRTRHKSNNQVLIPNLEHSKAIIRLQCTLSSCKRFLVLLHRCPLGQQHTGDQCHRCYLFALYNHERLKNFFLHSSKPAQRVPALESGKKQHYILLMSISHALFRLKMRTRLRQSNAP